MSAYWICCHCDAPLSCAACGVEQPNDSAHYDAIEVQLAEARSQLVCATDILQSLFPLHRMVVDQHADKHDAVSVGWTIDLGTIRRASKFITAQVTQSS